MQQDIVNKYKKERGGKIQTIVSVREDWGDWSTPHLDKLMAQASQIIDKGADLLYIHGAYCDRVVRAEMQDGKKGNVEVLEHFNK
jgi:cytoplasmic iron level regulating protein YaaA (DUF328/UPF0246 family)